MKTDVLMLRLRLEDRLHFPIERNAKLSEKNAVMLLIEIHVKELLKMPCFVINVAVASYEG